MIAIIRVGEPTDSADLVFWAVELDLYAIGEWAVVRAYGPMGKGDAQGKFLDGYIKRLTMREAATCRKMIRRMGVGYSIVTG